MSLIYHIGKEKLIYEERCKDLRIWGMGKGVENWASLHIEADRQEWRVVWERHQVMTVLSTNANESPG